MWKDYSLNYIKKNKTTSVSIIVAVLIASVFISCITGVFYNMWIDNIHRIVGEEGDWQGRLIGEFSAADIDVIKSYPNVRAVVVGETKSAEQAADIYFYNQRSIYTDLPVIAGQIGADRVEYHNLLLTQYYIYSPEEAKNPPLVLSFYVAVMLLTCAALCLIIYHAFRISMNARLHQLGILQSVGATPRQIRAALIQEALVLSFVPILIGIGAGIGLNYGFVHISNQIGAEIRDVDVVFHYEWWVFLVTFVPCLLTVLISAWVGAGKISKITPLEAIRNGAERRTGKMKRFHSRSLLFGIEGELAKKSFYVRRKTFRTSTISLTLSFLVFSLFLNFMTLSDISTRHTYFERYKDTWDFLVSSEKIETSPPKLLSNIRAIPGVLQCIRYQKAAGYSWLPEELLSDELKALGGPDTLGDTGIIKEGKGYWVNVPFLVLDDQSFIEYCRSAGISDDSEQAEAVVINRIWDSQNSHFRDREHLPFIKLNNADMLPVFTERGGSESVMLPLSAGTEQLPKLREEHESYSLSLVMPDYIYQSIADEFPAEAVYYNIVTDPKAEAADIENQLTRLFAAGDEYTIEGRIEAEEFNVAARLALNIILGILCTMMALIGLANIFSNTLGLIYQRRREFARYISVGMTPEGVKTVLFIEAFRIAVRPVLISLPLNAAFVVYTVNASRIPMSEFIADMPLVPLLLFAVLIWIFVGLAYYIGWKKLCGYPIVESLKEDTMY